MHSEELRRRSSKRRSLGALAPKTSLPSPGPEHDCSVPLGTKGYLANFVIPLDLRQFGIQPRELRGLRGVLVSPLLHMNLAHLAANSGALFVLLALALSFSRDLAVTAILFVVVLGGGGVWLFGTGHTNVIGASGVVFGLLGFLLGIGLFRGEWRSLLLSSVVLCFYGGILLTLLHNTPGVSWLGHASGFIVGVLSAWWTRRFDR